jgi:hypothetical protein
MRVRGVVERGKARIYCFMRLPSPSSVLVPCAVGCRGGYLAQYLADGLLYGGSRVMVGDVEPLKAVSLPTW